MNRLTLVRFALLALTSSFFTADAQVTGLSFRPVDAAYSLALDRIVMISASPNQLHIYDPVGQTDQAVALAETPLNLSLSSDGMHAAVAFSDAVAYVDLGSATVAKQFPNIAVGTGNAPGKVVVGSGYIYVVPSYVGSTISINISSGATTTGAGFSYMSGGAFDPLVNAIYSAGTSFGSLTRIDTSGGVAGASTSQSGAFGQFTVCSPIFLSSDGTTIYSGCGGVFKASNDATKDMQYFGLLPFPSQAETLSISNVLHQVAAIPTVPSYVSTSPQTLADTFVNIYDVNSLSATGTFATTPFTVNSKSFPAHGRWVFYNSSSSAMFIITQADSTAALTQDYAVENVNLSNANSCNATFSTATAAVAGPGGYATAQINSGEDCEFTAVSNAPWITLSSGYYGSGNTTLTYLARPNPTSSSRSGTISLGSQTLTVTQAAASAVGTLNPLSFKPVAADYAKALDKIVMVSAAPNELHIYDPTSGADSVIPLSTPPLSVSVAPGGTKAAVGQSGRISIVDLSAQNVSQTFAVNCENVGIVLANNGYAYTFCPSSYSSTTVHSVQLSTATLTNLQSYSSGTRPHLDSSGTDIYTAGYGVTKLSIGNGPASATNISGQGVNNLWLSEDGSRLITANGQAYFTSSNAAQDLTADGTLSAANNVDWAANSQIQHQTAVLTDLSSTYGSTPNTNTQLQIYGDDGLTLQSQMDMPGFSNNGAGYISHGKYLFWNAAESKLFAITEADSTAGLLSDYAVNTVNAPESLPACSYSISPASLLVPSIFVNTFTYTVTSNCDWQAKVSSNSSWLINLPSGVTSGNGTFAVEWNINNGAARSATISVGTATATVTQAAASSCTYAISPLTGVQIGSGGGAGAFTLMTGANCPWFAQSTSQWLTVSAGSQAGTGPATIRVVAAANTGSSGSRYGYVNIAGTEGYVSQAAAPGNLIVSQNQLSLSAPVGGSATATLTIQNTGGSFVTTNSLTTSAPFSAKSSFYGVGAGQTVTVTVTFSATSALPVSGTLTINSNGINPTAAVALNGIPIVSGDGAYDDRYQQITYSGNWGQNYDIGRFNGTQSYSNTTGNTATFVFSGTQVAYVYEAQANMGHVQVSIDGSVVTADLDEYSPSLQVQQRIIYTGLSAGIHTISVMVLGYHSGSSANSYGIVDAFLVGNRADAYDDRDPQLSYSGAWGQNSDEGRFEGTQSYSNRAQDSVSFTFTGTQVTYVYETQGNMGHAQVSIDGAVVTADLDEYSAAVVSQKRTMYSGLSQGTHTITVSVLGTKDAASTNSYVIVDAFLLGSPMSGSYDDGDPEIGYIGSWQSNTDIGRYLGTQTFSNVAGDSASFTFNGTQVAYVYEPQSNMGHAQITLDGAVVTPDLDEYSLLGKGQQQVIFPGLSSGTHTIQVSVLGTKDAASSSSYVIVDGFVVGPLGPGVYDDADPAVSYVGTWGHNIEYTRWADTQSYSATAGDTASFTFQGTQVAYLYATQPNLGHVQVSIDGTVVTADLDEYSATPKSQLRMVYSGLSNGTHTITVKILGTSDAAAAATYGVVDGFIVGSGAYEYDDRDPAVSYLGAWGTNTDAGRYEGTQTFNAISGSQCSFTFTGTGVTYVYDAQANMGHAMVTIDGNVVDASLDEYSATLVPQQQRVYSGLAAGQHTITVTVLGNSNAASSGSYVIVDAFIVTP